MPLWSFSVPTTIALNVIAVLLLHLGVSALTVCLPLAWFNPDAFPFRSARWEQGGRIWQRLFGVTRWKRRLPDGAALFRRGFRKQRLSSRAPAYLDAFARETCRAELTHGLMIALAPIFFLWNPIAGGVAMALYALAVNLPCLIAQRYNRPVLQRLHRRSVALSKRLPSLVP